MTGQKKWRTAARAAIAGIVTAPMLLTGGAAGAAPDEPGFAGFNCSFYMKDNGSFDVQWSWAQMEEADRFIVARQTDAWHWRASVEPDMPFYDDSPSPAGNDTLYRITAVLTDGRRVTTGCDNDNFGSEDLSCNVESNGAGFDVTWTLEGDEADKFVIKRQTSNLYWRGRVDGNVSSFTDSASPAGPETPYRVSAHLSNGDVLDADCFNPGVGNNPNISCLVLSTDDGGFRVTWNEIDNVDRYFIERHTTDWYWRGAVEAGTTSFSDGSSPTASTPYRVSAILNDGSLAESGGGFCDWLLN